MTIEELVQDLRAWDFSQGGPWMGHDRAKRCMAEAADIIERLLTERIAIDRTVADKRLLAELESIKVKAGYAKDEAIKARDAANIAVSYALDAELHAIRATEPAAVNPQHREGGGP